MKTFALYLLYSLLSLIVTGQGSKSKSNEVRVLPRVINAVLVNPGIGFTTLQRFNGDTLNQGSRWAEGLPIAYQKNNGNLINKDYPQTSIAYFRVNWRFLEPEMQNYNWDMIDKALKTTVERGQTLMLRISPYEAGDEKDVPDWYRKMVGKEIPQKSQHWRIDHNDHRFVQYFGGMVEALGQRYDGQPGIESVDISFAGYWVKEKELTYSPILLDWH
jgi:hypothetical protein